MPLDGAGDRLAQLIPSKRFQQARHDAVAPHRGRRQVPARGQDHGHVGVVVAELVDQPHAVVLTGQPHIADGHPGMPALGQRERLFRRTRVTHRVAKVSEPPVHGVGHEVFVLDDQEWRHLQPHVHKDTPMRQG